MVHCSTPIEGKGTQHGGVCDMKRSDSIDRGGVLKSINQGPLKI